MGRLAATCSFVIAAWVAALGCSGDRFLCANASSCVGPNGAEGWCEDTGFCSFPDPECPSGRRYGNAAADPLAGRCVPLPDQAGTSADDGADSDTRGTVETEGVDGADGSTSAVDGADADGAITTDEGTDPETSASADDNADESTSGMSPETTTGVSDVEVCNGIDDDGDGLVDEVSDLNDSCETCRQLQRDDRAYQFCEQALAWPDARDECRSRGFELVALESDAENDDITEFADRASFGDFWIGANDLDVEGQWVWPDETPLDGDDYARFRSGEPNNSGDNEHCAEIEVQGAHEWDDKDCSVAQGYICEAVH